MQNPFTTTFSKILPLRFVGSVEQWNNIEIAKLWNYKIPATKVICSDGEVTL